MESLPALFGSPKKTKYLVALAELGSCHRREISREARLERVEEIRFTRQFLRQQIVVQGSDKRLQLNDRFVAVDELRAFLAELRGRIYAYQKKSRSALGEFANLEAVLGGIYKTRILIHLERCPSGEFPRVLASKVGLSFFAVHEPLHALVDRDNVSWNGSPDGIVALSESLRRFPAALELIRRIRDVLEKDAHEAASLDSAQL